MATDVLTSDPRFRQLAVRVRLRSLLQALLLGAAGGLVGAALVTLAGKLAGLALWPYVAAAWLTLSLLAALMYALLRTPDMWAVARAADGLGLAERISSAVYAQARSASVAELLVADARRALARLEPSGYQLTGSPGIWRALALGASVLLILVVAPIPRLGSDANSHEDAARVTAAQQRVEAMELQPPNDDQRASALGQKTSEEVRALRDALARSESSSEAARAIENTQRQLAQLPGADDYAWRRSLDATASALEAQRDQALIPLTRALRDRDAQAADRALADLAAQFDQPGGMSDAERAQVRSALQAAANAASGSQPRLASALRRAASSANGAGLNSDELRDLLAEGSADAGALDGLEQSLGDLSQLRATTLPAGATLVPARGTPTAYALVRGTPPPNATLVAMSGAGQGASAGASSGPQGNGGGNGPQGNGAGGGAGYGNTPSQGQPSTTSASSGPRSGQQVAPNSSAATTYDPVYAPSRLGGEGGPAVQPGGDPTGAGGAGVDLPQGPLTVGDVRPYDQVYAQYAQEARQSTSRQSLPPNVQNVVDRYFGSIAPPTDAQP